MKVTVTQDHINRGTREKCRSCPIALAINDVPNFSGAFVGTELASFMHRYGGAQIKSLPNSAKIFISQFDQGAHVEPFEFELDFTS